MEILNRIEQLLREEIEEEGVEDENTKIVKHPSLIMPKEFRQEKEYKFPYMKRLFLKMGRYPESKLRKIWLNFAEEMEGEGKDRKIALILNLIFKKPMITSLDKIGRMFKKRGIYDPNIDLSSSDRSILNLSESLMRLLYIVLGDSALSPIQPLSLFLAFAYKEGVIGDDQDISDIITRTNKATKKAMLKVSLKDEDMPEDNQEE